MITACANQKRAVMRDVQVGPNETIGRFMPYALDFGAVLAYAQAAGAVSSLLLDILPDAEAIIVAAGETGFVSDDTQPNSEEG